MTIPVDISIIVAMCQNRVIGRDGGMPWHLPGELQYFKKVTMSKPVVMGRRTFESIGRPLPGRANIVITRDAAYAPDGVIVAHTLSDALRLATEHAVAGGATEVMVIGGGQVYAETLDQASRVYLTEIHATIDGDTFFPALPPEDWLEVSRFSDDIGEHSDPRYSFAILERI
ncbi:MAG: dihydrofolate reductase [Rhodospirillales bacterium]|jgi:dihydrofolate reductase|nr:dihydrofolate reductase [Rhodospirillales bacterium]MBT4041431.1 dihydrofolate reductase [Rhodospirillales bacterium]MBT4628272.1 dihydrofolate reductase [Rhodospirillales bacterium]MBT5352286.1 dihydrofolate reductase [Rhodospirillales bacterium]MBT5521065.1 dihydrofolate reductase [Rhodospirillales bacterium]